MNNVQRVRMVLGRIEELPEAEKNLAETLYLLILRIELFHWSCPNSCGMLAAIAGSLTAAAMDLRIPFSGSLELAAILIFMALMYLLGFLGSKVLIFNRLRDRLIREIRNLRISNCGFSKAMEFLKQTDLRIHVNIGGLLAQAEV